MDEQQGKISSYIKNSVILKVFIIGILVLVLLAPASMIMSLITEREGRRDSVIKELSSKWGSNQTITGPFITVPYKPTNKSEHNKGISNLEYFYILPDTLEISGEIKPEVRYRSLFEAVLYNATLEFKGTFQCPSMSQLNIEQDSILWDKSYIALGISDFRGIQDKIKINMNDVIFNCNPGLKTTDIAPSGVSSIIGVPLSSDKPNSFSFTLNLNGSEQLNFIPVAAINMVKLTSKWPSPSFNGAFLPTAREVTDNGFTANWKVLDLNRDYPQFWAGRQYKVDASSFGLKLILTADIYQKTMRITKYAILFLIFTFSAFFLSEIITKRRIHPIQYILIGMAILLFYSLLLSFSEYIDFNYAYIGSATMITFLITCYSYGITKDKKFACCIFLILSMLYSYLFVILQMEDYALMMGNIGVLTVLSLVMYLTRKIDWYAIEL